MIAVRRPAQARRVGQVTDDTNNESVTKITSDVSKNAGSKSNIALEMIKEHYASQRNEFKVFLTERAFTGPN
jgi:hypothetical protein